jgi:hypothetical protein
MSAEQLLVKLRIYSLAGRSRIIKICNNRSWIQNTRDKINYSLPAHLLRGPIQAGLALAIKQPPVCQNRTQGYTGS